MTNKQERQIAKMLASLPEEAYKAENTRLRAELEKANTTIAANIEERTRWYHTRERYRAVCKAYRAELAALRQSIKEQAYEVEQALGNALYGTDRVTGNPLWGDHTAETLAREAAKELAVQRRALDILAHECRTLEWSRARLAAISADLGGLPTVPVATEPLTEYIREITAAALEQARKEKPNA